MRALAVLAALALAGCASSKAFRLGEQAERRQDYDRAVIEYSRALTGSPANKGYRWALERVRQRASLAHQEQGRRLMARAQFKEALDEFRLAFDLNPRNDSLLLDMRDAEARRQAGQRAASLAEIKEAAREKPLQGLKLGPGADEPLGLSFRGASLREAYQALGRVAGVNFVFDPQYQDAPVSIDVRDVPYHDGVTPPGRVRDRLHPSRL